MLFQTFHKERFGLLWQMFPCTNEGMKLGAVDRHGNIKPMFSGLIHNGMGREFQKLASHIEYLGGW